MKQKKFHYEFHWHIKSRIFVVMKSTPKFYLKSNTSDTATPILLNLKINGKSFRYSIQKSILPELWDKENQLPTSEKKLLSEYKKEIPTLKDDLNNIRNRIVDISREVKNYIYRLEEEGKTLDKVNFKAHLDSKFKHELEPVKDMNVMGMNDYIQHFYKGVKSGSITIDSGKSQGLKYSEGTIRVWKGWVKQFELFQASNRLLDWSDVNMEVYNQLLQYFYEKDYAVNTVGKIIGKLKVILRKGYEEGLHTNSIYKDKRFKTLEEEVDKIALTKEEVEKLSSIDLSHNKRWELNRDVFLI